MDTSLAHELNTKQCCFFVCGADTIAFGAFFLMSPLMMTSLFSDCIITTSPRGRILSVVGLTFLPKAGEVHYHLCRLSRQSSVPLNFSAENRLTLHFSRAFIFQLAMSNVTRFLLFTFSYSFLSGLYSRKFTCEQRPKIENKESD